MAQLRLDIRKMQIARGIREQVIAARECLQRVLDRQRHEDPRGRAFKVCETWQRRFLAALGSEIPDWVGLAGFRCIVDFGIPRADVKKIFPREPEDLDVKAPCPRDVDTFDQCWLGYRQYFEQEIELYSGKLNLTLNGPTETHFLRNLPECAPVLGGQAGNVLWLWHSIGAAARAYTFYLSRDVAELYEKLPTLADLQCFKFQDGCLTPYLLGKSEAGLKTSSGSGSVNAPSGGSFVVFESGRRLCYVLKGVRDLRMRPGDPMPWDRVCFRYMGNDLADGALERPTNGDTTWPTVPLFGECHIGSANTLVIEIAGEEGVREIARRVDFAILGGLDQLFSDITPYKVMSAALRDRLVRLAEKQLRVLASGGVRIGIELSGVPGHDYANFLARLCRDGVIVALGINGIDELPDVVGKDGLTNKLHEFWLDPVTVPKELGADQGKEWMEDKHYEYRTYLRAKQLAQAVGVRTLYVHTTTLDLVLRKDGDPGALLRAQQGDMMGKGLVIAALLHRAYGAEWYGQLGRMPAAVNPLAMERLGSFAADFDEHTAPGSFDRLLESGYWLAPSPNEYSVAVVPVMWPPVSERGSDPATADTAEKGQDGGAPQLPERLNTTGSGDMTFAAFFLLGGV